MAENTNQNDPHSGITTDWDSLKRGIIIAAIRAMITRLQATGDFTVPAGRFEEMGLRDLNFLFRQLRDTLRTLGGGR